MRYKSTIRAASAIAASRRCALTWNAHANLNTLFHNTVRTMTNSAVWVDTDCGFDDLCGLSLLQDYSSDSASKIVYVSTVNGMTDPFTGAGVINKILHLSECSLDIACGADSLSGQKHSISEANWGLDYKNSFSRFVEQHLQTNQDTSIHTLNSEQSECGQYSSLDDLILRISDLDKGVKVTLLCLGPLTNIAYVIKKYPEIFAERVDRMILMGGAVLAKGNAPGNAEYNFYMDPESASFALQNCKVPIVMVGLEVANDEAISADQLLELRSAIRCGRNEELKEASPSNKVEPLKDEKGNDTVASGNIPSNIKEFLRELILYNKDAASYDPIACYYLICPEAFTFQLTNITIDSQTGCTTVVLSTIEDKEEQPHEIVAVNLATALCKTSYFIYLLSTLK